MNSRFRHRGTSHRVPRDRVTPLSERTLVFALFLMLAYPVWVMGGSRSAFIAPLTWLGSWTLLLLLVLPTCDVMRDAATSGRPISLTGIARAVGAHLLALLRDPVFYCALLFLALVAVQWFNAGRALDFDTSTFSWKWGEPPFPKLPSAINKQEAAMMWHRFFPAFVLLLALRHGIPGARSRRMLLWLVLLNGTVLGILGIAQFLSKTDVLLWGRKLTCDVFATFGYANHAGSYLILMYCLTFALLLPGLGFDDRDRRNILRSLLLGVAAIVFLASLHMTLSRAAILLAWIVTLTGATVLTRSVFRLGTPSQRVNYCAALAVTLVLMAFAAPGLKGSSLIREASRLVKSGEYARDVDVRFWQINTAVGIIRDYPVFGAGGEAYQHMVGHYLAPEHWHLLKIAGKANVHNDILQFGVEYGLLGVLLLAACIITVAWPLMPRLRGGHLSAMNGFLLLGVAIELGHSLIDLPFRSVAVLYTWLTLLVIGSSWHDAAEDAAPATERRNRAKAVVWGPHRAR